MIIFIILSIAGHACLMIRLFNTRKERSFLSRKIDRLQDDYESLDDAFNRVDEKLRIAKARAASMERFEISEKQLKAETETLKQKIMSLESQIAYLKARTKNVGD